MPVLLKNSDDLDLVLPDLAAGKSASYRRLALLCLAGFEYLRLVKVSHAEDAAAAVYADVAQRIKLVRLAAKLAGLATLTGLYADDLGTENAAVAQRHDATGVAVADAVTESAVDPGLRIVKGERADAAYAVTQPKSETVSSVRAFRRSEL